MLYSTGNCFESVYPQSGDIIQYIWKLQCGKQNFYIESAKRSLSSNDVEFQQYATYVIEVLKLQGAIPTSNKTKADMCILMDYGIIDESYVETVPVPIWGETGISSITTNTRGNMYSNSNIYGSGVRRTTVDYDYGITGYHDVQQHVSKFRRALNLYAYDNQNKEEPKMLWKTNIHSDGRTNDLAGIIPYMVYSTWGGLGDSSEGRKDVDLFEDDFLFRVWKQGCFTQDNYTIVPSNKSYSQNMELVYVARYKNETIACLRKTGLLKEYSLGSDFYIEYDGKKTYISNVGGGELNSKIKNENGLRYFTLHFPVTLPKSANINIAEETQKGTKYSWTDIQLK